jgi:hypothetical protein
MISGHGGNAEGQATANFPVCRQLLGITKTESIVTFKGDDAAYKVRRRLKTY